MVSLAGSLLSLRGRLQDGSLAPWPVQVSATRRPQETELPARRFLLPLRWERSGTRCAAFPRDGRLKRLRARTRGLLRPSRCRVPERQHLRRRAGLLPCAKGQIPEWGAQSSRDSPRVQLRESEPQQPPTPQARQLQRLARRRWTPPGWFDRCRMTGNRDDGRGFRPAGQSRHPSQWGRPPWWRVWHHRRGLGAGPRVDEALEAGFDSLWPPYFESDSPGRTMGRFCAGIPPGAPRSGSETGSAAVASSTISGDSREV